MAGRRVFSVLAAVIAVLPLLAAPAPVLAAKGQLRPLGASRVEVLSGGSHATSVRNVAMPARAADATALRAAKLRAERSRTSSPAAAPTTCTSVTLAANPASPSPAGGVVTFTGSAAGCDTPTYEFWVQAPGAAWALLQGYSSSASTPWNTAGLADGTYLFDVWARQAGSSADLEAHLSPSATYTLGPPCTSVTLSSSPSGTAPPGALVTFSAVAAGCPNPEYEFWLQAPGSPWQVLRGYAQAASATWDTTGFAQGTYLLDVWARQAGAVNQWEAHISPNPTYTLAANSVCSSVSLGANPPSPQAPGPAVTFSSVASGCSSPTYEFWIQPPGSGWQVLQGWSASASATWNTAGLTTGGYLLDVWARQSGSAAQFEAHLSPNPTYVLAVGAACTSVSLSASPASPSPPGTTVTFTAVAAGCPDPTYEFFVQAPGGSWQVLQGYGPSASATWGTSGLVAGTYLLDVWARESGSAAQFEAHLSPNATYVLGPPCSSVSLAANPVSPQPPGAVVSFTGTAAGCPQPEYEFWLQAPGGGWQVLRGYASAPTTAWDTTGLVQGTYLLDVWARQSGSAAQYEAHLSPNATYVLGAGPACTSVTLAASPPSPQQQGVTVTFSASASGCPNPTYEFWLQPPGGAWQVLQGFGPASSAAWNTSGQPAGTYLLDVWARQSGSSAQYEAHLSPNPTYTVNAPPACTSVSLAASPPSPATAGTTVTFTASSAGCASPEYKFWLQAPDAPWQVLRNYAASPTAVWNTGGLGTATYLLDVWVRQAGSTVDWQAHISPNPTYRLSVGWHGLDSPGISAASEGFCCVPPDTTGSIGPANYVEIVNTTVAVYDRNLNQVSSLDMASFSGAGALNVSDPNLQWDPRGQRWFYSLVAFTTDLKTTKLLIGWSKTANPTNLSSGWCRFAVATGTMLPDYPKLGHDDNFVVVGANVYDVGQSSQPFITAQLWVARKPAVGDASCTAPAAFFTFADSTHPLRNADGSLAFTPVPANTSDASTGGLVVAAHTPTLAPLGPQTKIAAWQLALAGAVPVLNPLGDLTVASFDVPASAPQPGGPVIDTLDARLTQAVAHADPSAGGAEAVWTQQTINGPGGRSVVRWYELLPATLTVRQQGQVSSTTDFVFNGAISPSISGNDAAVFYNRGGTSRLPLIGGRTHSAAAALGTLGGAETVFATSSAVDADFSCVAPYGPPCRWGDYAGASPDPLNAGVIWGSNQVNSSNFFGFPGWASWNFAIHT